MKKNSIGLAMVAPGLLFVFMILIVPLFYTLFISLHNFNHLSLGGFVGIKNYMDLFDAGTFWCLVRTISISAASVAISIFLGLLLSLWVEKRTGTFGFMIQLVGLVTWVVSMIVSSLLWRWILDNDAGLLNYLLLALRQKPIDFFSSAAAAIATLILVMAWRTIGYSMVMILAGLKGIPHELIEAGRIDGASHIQLLLHIKLPLIVTSLLIASIVVLLSNFNNVTVPMALTGGGPADATNVLSMVLYRQGFIYFAFGRASALALFMIVITTVLVTAYIRLVKYEV